MPENPEDDVPDDRERPGAIGRCHGNETALVGISDLVGADAPTAPTADAKNSGQAPTRLGAELRSALLHDELVLHYQPLVRTDGSIRGAEALIRWSHPERGWVCPGVLLSVARKAGLLTELDKWVLRSALSEAASWRADSHGHPVDVGVNLTGVVPGDLDYVDIVTGAVAETGIEWNRVVLEVIESELPARFRQAIEQLSGRGAQFTVDDFGTGYSSLARAKHLRTHIKIARELVDGIENDPVDRAVIRAAVNLAHAMGRSCVAEGVETTAQFRILSSLGVDYYQGWLFSHAVPADQFRNLLAHGDLHVPSHI